MWIVCRSPLFLLPAASKVCRKSVFSLTPHDHRPNRQTQTLCGNTTVLREIQQKTTESEKKVLTLFFFCFPRWWCGKTLRGCVWWSQVCLVCFGSWTVTEKPLWKHRGQYLSSWRRPPVWVPDDSQTLLLVQTQAQIFTLIYPLRGHSNVVKKK